MRTDNYKLAGVDTDTADKGLAGIIARVTATWPRSGNGRVVLPIGFFANVIEVDGAGIAICTDGVGTKTIVASMLGRYDTIGIDCVAMNVNDMICVGARPLSMVDYIAVDKADAAMLEAIGIGLAEGARQAGISISGGETAQLGQIVTGFDIAGMAIGRVPLDRVLCGQDVQPGDIVIGVRSSGIHSNGLSMARRAFFEGPDAVAPDHVFPEIGRPIGEELLEPTHIYVPEAMEILDTVKGVKALINITSDGILNLSRSAAAVDYVVDTPIEPHPLFGLIQRRAGVDDVEMYEMFNMGTGFCYVVAPEAADETLAILRRHGRVAQVIGRAVPGREKLVHLPSIGIVGTDKTFRRA